MAKKQTVQFVDDIDGKVLDEFVTVRWALDGKEYEFDTSPKHAAQFHKAIDKYLAVSRRVNNTRATKPKNPAAKKSTNRTADIRAWAMSNGYEIGDRGRIPSTIVDAYDAAN